MRSRSVHWTRSCLRLALAALAALTLAACGSTQPRQDPTASAKAARDAKALPPGVAPGPLGSPSGARGNVDFYDGPNALTGPALRALPRIYVPNTMSNTVDVIDPATMRVVSHFAVGELPQHVTPSYDMRTLWVDNDLGNSLTPIDPNTGRPRGRPVPVEDPYNLYFAPNGRYAIVVAERLQKLDFRDPQTMQLRHSISVPQCAGVDHADFSASGRFMFASCEFAGRMIKIDLATMRVVKTLSLAGGVSSPQDVKLSPFGKILYVADQSAGGVWEIDPLRFPTIGFVRTGAGAHGLYVSRDQRSMYVSNRAEGSVSVIGFASHRVIHKWRIPGPASPDMGGVSADGRTLWLSGRYNAEVYAIDTSSGGLRARIPVGQGPHGLAVWPQPGRFSLGHTGIMR
jgi:YVTN family beta-propeller protein